MIEQLDRSNHPKTELSLLELDNQDIKIILKHDEVKYIYIIFHFVLSVSLSP